jgi:hypothetical protein
VYSGHTLHREIINKTNVVYDFLARWSTDGCSCPLQNRWLIRCGPIRQSIETTAAASSA